jgi:hypothetical protein
MRQELSEFSRHAGALLQHVHSQVAALVAATTSGRAVPAAPRLPDRANPDQLLLQGGNAPYPPPPRRPPALAWHQGGGAEFDGGDGDDAPGLATALARAPTETQQQQQRWAAWRGGAAHAASASSAQQLEDQLSALPAYATRSPAPPPSLPPYSPPSGSSRHPAVASGVAVGHTPGNTTGHKFSTAHASRHGRELEPQSEEAGLPSYSAFRRAVASARLPAPPGPLPRAPPQFLATGQSSEAALRAAVRGGPRAASEVPAYAPQRGDRLDNAYEEVHAPEADAYVYQLRAEEAAREQRAQAREQAGMHGGHNPPPPPSSGSVPDYSRLYPLPPTFVPRAAGSSALDGLRDARTLAGEAELRLSGMDAVAGGYGPQGAAGRGRGGYTAGIDAALAAASTSPDRMAPLPPGVQRTWLPFAVEDSARAHPPALSPHASPRGGASQAPFGTFRGLATGLAGAPVTAMGVSLSLAAHAQKKSARPPRAWDAAAR